VVTNCRVELTAVLPGVTLAGKNEHEAAAGKPEQLSDTGDPKLAPNEFKVTV